MKWECGKAENTILLLQYYIMLSLSFGDSTSGIPGKAGTDWEGVRTLLDSLVSWYSCLYSRLDAQNKTMHEYIMMMLLISV